MSLNQKYIYSSDYECHTVMVYLFVDGKGEKMTILSVFPGFSTGSGVWVMSSTTFPSSLQASMRLPSPPR